MCSRQRPTRPRLTARETLSAVSATRKRQVCDGFQVASLVLTRVRIRRCLLGEAPERGELAEAVESSDEQAGVDGAGDGWTDLDGGDDGDVEHAGHVFGAQRPPRLDDEDHAIRWAARGVQEARQGDVARSPQYGVTLDVVRPQEAAEGLFPAGAGIDHRDLGSAVLRIGHEAE